MCARLRPMVSLGVLINVVIVVVHAIDNGIGLTPPRGWRSWNQFQCAINQSLIEDHYELLAKKMTMPGMDKPTSLLDLGYKTAGIDDCWQKCDSGPNGKGFHNASGYPIVDTSVFPDMKAMTAKARSLGLIAGWYGNNCHCADHTCSEEKCFQGDVQATLDYGFGSIKLDGCGVQKNITLYSELFNRSGTPVMLENCHNGNPTYPTGTGEGKVDCPMNFFRSSTDIRPTFGSILINLESTAAYNGKGLTGPGCFAYPDMLEVGVTNSQRPGLATLSFTEARTHFGAWCIVSAPLVLGMDLRDEAKLAEVLPIISNTEAMAVNDAWAGDAGVLAKASAETVTLPNCSWFNKDSCKHPAWMVWKKRLPKGKVAVLLMNNANTPATVSVQWKDVGATCGANGCPVRDVWAHKDLGMMKDGFSAAELPSRDSSFLVISPS